MLRPSPALATRCAPRAACRCTATTTAASAPSSAAALDALLASTAWLFPSAGGSEVTALAAPPGSPPLARPLLCLRDDRLRLGPSPPHSLVGGNKARKLDGLLPRLALGGATDVVSCCGAHSAHASALAAACAALRLRCHLIVRAGDDAAGGGGPGRAVLAGHGAAAAALGARLLLAPSRASYDAGGAARLIAAEAARLEAGGGGVRCAAVPEGGAEPGAALGLLRAVRAWSSPSPPPHPPRPPLLPPGRRVALTVDAGTGATAWGLALAVHLLRLPWTVVAVPVAAPAAAVADRCVALGAAWNAAHGGGGGGGSAAAPSPLAAPPLALLPLVWAPAPGGGGGGGDRGGGTPPPPPPPAGRHRFGTVAPRHVAACRALLAASAVLADPVWTLHAHAEAARLAAAAAAPDGEGAAQGGGGGYDLVVWVHAGGSEGAWAGLAARHRSGGGGGPLAGEPFWERAEGWAAAAGLFAAGVGVGVGP